MTRALRWTAAGGFASVAGTRVSLPAKPELAAPAAWVWIDYADGAGTCTVRDAEGHDQVQPLDATAVAAVEAYLATLDGFAAAPGPRCYGVGADGSYLGLVDLAAAHGIVAAPMPDGEAWLLSANGWNPVLTLARVQADALAAIDNAAGTARLRYITEVAGQQATYIAKAQQAQALVDAPTSTPGPYIVAEAQALNVTALAAAQGILAVAAQWDGTIGPAIEKARRAGKLAVSAASTVAEVSTARANALAALSTI